jgi:acetyl-CoA synthetase
MIPEAAMAMLACARIGAIHSVVFGGFSPDALAGRIVDCGSSLLITADEGWRGGKVVPLKRNVDRACERPGVMDCLRAVLVVRNTGGAIDWREDRDHWYHEEEGTVSADCPPEPMNAEDPLFILYTSGSTGQPKGVRYHRRSVVATTKSCSTTTRRCCWCTDVGGYRSQLHRLRFFNGAITLMFEGVPNHPDASRL